jgi:hypothetical protein
MARRTVCVTSRLACLLLVSFGLTACSGHVMLSPYGMRNATHFVLSDEARRRDGGREWAMAPNFSVEKRVSTPVPWHTVEVSVRELLAKNGVDPDRVQRVRYEILDTPWDVARSFLPFMASKTVRIEGYVATNDPATDGQVPRTGDSR